jgi:DNA-binding NarL/FixJ family response regulator
MTRPPSPLRVLIADPDALARRALTDALRDGGIHVVASAGHVRDLIALAGYHQPDIVVLEATLPGLDADVIARTANHARIVVLAATADPARALGVLRAGASGFLAKDVDPDTLPRVLRRVAEGEAVIPRTLTGLLLENLRRIPDHGWRPLQSPLTTREWEIIDLLSSGACTDEIAARLVLSRATVYTHIKHILRKLHVRTRADAVQAAQQLRRVQPTPA